MLTFQRRADGVYRAEGATRVYRIHREGQAWRLVLWTRDVIKATRVYGQPRRDDLVLAGRRTGEESVDRTLALAKAVATAYEALVERGTEHRSMNRLTEAVGLAYSNTEV